MRRAADLRLYLVLDPVLCGPAGMAATARAAALAGAGVVQLRLKGADTATVIREGRLVQQALAGTGAAFVVNDDAEAACALDADGLHVGQGDLAPDRARALIGPDRMLGLSVETLAQAQAVDPALVDHVGVGPLRATATKPDHALPLGAGGLRAVVAACPVPAVAIGGVGPGDGALLRAAGCAGMAVVSAICGQPDPGAAARALLQEMTP